MDTRQLMALLRCVPQTQPYFLGVFPRDGLPPAPPTHRGTYCFILNTDRHDQEGSHWLAIFRNPQQLDFFDSYGLSPDAYGLSFKKYHRNVRYNTRQIQPTRAETCGLHCAYFLMARCQGIPYENIITKMYYENSQLNDLLILLWLNAHLQKHEGYYCQ